MVIERAIIRAIISTKTSIPNLFRFEGDLHSHADFYLNSITGILQLCIIAVVVEPMMRFRMRECP